MAADKEEKIKYTRRDKYGYPYIKIGDFEITLTIEPVGEKKANCCIGIMGNFGITDFDSAQCMKKIVRIINTELEKRHKDYEFEAFDERLDRDDNEVITESNFKFPCEGDEVGVSLSQCNQIEEQILEAMNARAKEIRTLATRGRKMWERN